MPHNSNRSKGCMVEPVDNASKPLTAEYAKQRSHFERLIERMQIQGNTMDLQKATFTNTIGSPRAMGRWTDRAFDPKQHALHCVRVLEIPTPRFTTCDALRNNLPLRKDVPDTLQEGTWTSPIWYTPQS